MSYKTAIYKSTTEMSGSFAKIDLSEEGIKLEQIIWNEAKFVTETSNLKGVNDVVDIQINKNKYSFSSKYVKK